MKDYFLLSGVLIFFIASRLHYGVGNFQTPVEALLPVTDAWFGVHVIQIVCVALIAFGLIHVLHQIQGLFSLIARACIFMWFICFTVGDAVSGISGALLLNMLRLTTVTDPDTIQYAILTLMASPTTNAVFWVASYMWLLGIGFTFFALRRSRAYSLMSIYGLMFAAAFLFIDHGNLWGTLTSISLLPLGIEHIMKSFKKRPSS